MKRWFWSYFLNIMLSIWVIIIISEYPILGKTTYGKPGMWYVLASSVAVQLIIIGTSMLTKIFLIGDLYQGICAFIFMIFGAIAFLCLTGILELVGILVSMIGIANCGYYFVSRVRNVKG